MIQPIVNARDIPIGQLVPMSERQVTAAAYAKISASILAVGLIDPLVVYPEETHFVILDGQLRYRILLENGIENVPCLIWNEKEAFTANRMVNRLSHAQAARMIRKSLEELDEVTIAKAFGMTQVRHRLNKNLMKRLHPKAVTLYETERLSTVCVKEFGFVAPKRQEEILKIMEGCDDYSVTMARALVLKTPISQRVKGRSGTRTPWVKNGNGQPDLLKQLKQAEEQQDFYATIYRQYSINLLKLVVYARRLLMNPKVRSFLDSSYPKVVSDFEGIIESAEA